MTPSTSKLRKSIKYLTLSDIHLRHATNPTVRILNNLEIYFERFAASSRFKDLDIIFFAGDLWDRLVDSLNDDIFEFMVFWDRLMRFCIKNKIKLRLLEGTKSHDRGQTKFAQLMASIFMEGLDLRYVTTLSIEHMDDLGIDVLYVPDEWAGSDADETLRQFEELLKEKHLQQVDIAIMHGMFGYQLEGIPGNHPKHSEQRYLELVRYYINIGHVHTFSFFDRIIAQGSFDRLKHNEEEAKGGVVCYLNPNGKNRFEFIENKEALIFKTLTIKQKDLEKAIAYIDKEVSKLPKGSHVRIKAAKTHPVYQALKELQLRHVYINFTRKSEEDADEDHQLAQIAQVEDDTAYVPFDINRENIVDLVLKELDAEGGLSATQSQLARELLEANC